MTKFKSVRHFFLALFVTAWLAAACATPPAGSHILWQIEGDTNTVYLLGSVHLLREDDYPLPAIYDQVYADAETLVMELDMDDLDPVRLQQYMIRTGMPEDGQTLQQLMGEAEWNKALNTASSLDINLELFNNTEPWLAALSIVELEMLKLGFDPTLGVEYHFLQRARDDSKPIEGLESAEEQIAVFDNLPIDVQLRFLLKTLEDIETIEEGLDTLIGAWRSGNLVVMQDELIKGFNGFPGVYDALVVKRNAEWTEKLDELLDARDDYLIIVGALHLIGPDSVIEQLRSRGYKTRQL
ncbi:MAG: TraB/GumN family protein [Gammaproteobacteria bacterium]|nr:TraB/GumN family protein [Gammaproteobacteria bacterium]